MCGIAGWVDHTGNLQDEREVVAAMTATMALRGPDDEGMWISDHAALGHRRLAVIDVAGGIQPMEVPGRAVIVYSGETYNFRELRGELRRLGHDFRTQSDTEVVLHAYLEWGEDFVHRLNGMYAMAIWDLRRQELLLVRDRMGIKPLYYAPIPGGVLFGSEPKAILANPLVTARIDDEGFAELLSNLKTPGHAVFSGIREVRPGHLVRVTQGGCDERRYWSLQATEHTDDVRTTVARVRELLEDIVTRQLISDVPLCTLLSGGLDSSALAALAARALGDDGPVRSFSVDFVDEVGGFVPDELRDTADAPYAAEVVKYVGTRHGQVMLSSDQLAEPDAMAAVLHARDLPGMGDMDTSLYLLFAEIRKHSTVALSGESADEVFGGYRWFHEPATVRTQTFPWLVTALGDAIGGGGGLLSRQFLERIRLSDYIKERYQEAVADTPYLPGQDATERRMREICYLHLSRFVQNLLDRKDRMSMAVGLEVRVPFCDHRLVEYVFNTPWSFKTYDGREKSLLRGATSDLLPDSVVQRVKSPYPSTQNPSYEQAVRDRLAQITADPEAPVRPFLDVEAVQTALARPLGQASLQQNRIALERVVILNDWLTAYHPTYEGASLA